MQRGRFDIRHDVFHIPAHLQVSIGLRWEFIGARPVDLDASAIAFDENNKCVEVVYFGNLSSRGGYMRHSGDSQTGENDDADDESITFDLTKIPQKVHYIMVCVNSYTGVPFTVVERATCRLHNEITRQVVHEFALSQVGSRTGVIVCALSRDQTLNNGHPEPIWALREINIPANGFTFSEMIPKMLEILPGEGEPMDLKTATEDLPRYSLVKEDTAKDVTPSQLMFGLGWDGDNDLDANVVMLTEEGEYVDHLFAKHGKLRSLAVAAPDGSAVFAAKHSGDKLNGYDVEGDDEFVEMDLNLLDPRICKVFFIAQLASGAASTLSKVENGYVRMRNKAPTEERYKELGRFSLKGCGAATTHVFAMVHRQKGSVWQYTAVNEKIFEGRDWIDVFPYLRCYSKCYNEGTNKWAMWRASAITPFYVLISFLAARDLGPLEPHHFSCHCEAWVCDQKGKGRFSTAICGDRDSVQWADAHPFKVRLIDRVRVMVYEHAMVGHVDLDLSGGLSRVQSEPVEEWFPLQGVGITGEVRLRIEHISDADAKQRLAPPNAGGSWCVIS